MSGQENRLGDLPSNIQELEQRAKENDNYKDLEQNLAKIRDILKNNPNKSEIESARSFLDALKEFKNIYKNQTESSTKVELGNLSGEVVLYNEIQKTLENIKSKTAQNKPSEGQDMKELIEKNNGRPKFEHVFLGVQNEMIKGAINHVEGGIIGQLTNYPLTPEQKQNICIGVITKMLNEGDFNNSVGGLGKVIGDFSNNVKNGEWGKIEETFEEFPKSKENQDRVMEVMQKVSDRTKVITNYFDNIKAKNPKEFESPLFKKFLNNPQEIANFDGKNFPINPQELSKEELVLFMQNTNAKMLALDNGLQGISGTKNFIMETLSEHSIIAIGFMKIIEWLLDMKSDFVNNLLKGFFGVDGDDILGGLKKDIEKRKSCKLLRTFGLHFNDDGTCKESADNSPSISYLKDKDLRDIKLDKMTDFFDFIEKNKDENKKIDITKKDFWVDIFNGDFNLKTGTKLPKIELKGEMFNINKKPNDKFFEYFNKTLIGQTPQALDVTPQNPTTETQKSESSTNTQSSGTDKGAEKNNLPPIIPVDPKGSEDKKGNPTEVKSNNLPDKIEYDSNNQIVTVDKKKFKLEAQSPSLYDKTFTYSINSVEYKKTPPFLGIKINKIKEISFTGEKVVDFYSELSKMEVGNKEEKSEKLGTIIYERIA